MGGQKDNPDVLQFQWAFRHVVIDRLFAPNVGNNCEVDYDEILLDIQSILKPKTAKFDSKSEMVPPMSQIPEFNVEPNYCDLEMSVDECVPSCAALNSSIELELIVRI